MRRRRGRAVLARGLWTAGELAVTLGVVVLLFCVHQLWWTNRQARADARHEVAVLERQWENEPAESAPTPGATHSRTSDSSDGTQGDGDRTTGGGGGSQSPRRDQAYAVLRIPRIGLTVPIAEGTSRAAVLNKGYVGHYPHTAQPGQAGNVALAGHRNTHGEPFRRLDEMRPGDTVRVDTADARYTYAVERTLPRTSPTDGTVIAPVPYSSAHPRYRYTEPGYYLTLTTCTPEFTSRYRLVVWARLKTAEPRTAAGSEHSVGGAD
ncbi:class E sortase [Streptomyces sp. S465]|uniref:class E sortase n=1 Tax=Streptomyces sp. S465 TaxID=2979468 RepID=UPI0022A82011|nr:class E sortase [Streptomyces sp. S465]WAP56269.1 class E sortase [Streptomyces sp. S465]